MYITIGQFIFAVEEAMALQSALFFLVGITSNVHATTMVPLSFEQLVDASDDIVKGQVTEVWTERDIATGMIWTHAQIEVKTVLKGEDELQVLIVEQPGGSWGSSETTIDGVARFSVGEEGYFFVEHLDSGRSVPVGMFQGKFNIVFNPYKQQRIATRFTTHPKQKFDHRFIPLPKENKRITIEQFELDIRAKKQKGWDGKSIPGTSIERLRRINKTQTTSEVK
jgi:hypothetical protein